MHICNACWGEINGQAFVTRCGHMFCNDDAERAVQAGECPVCQKAVQERHVKIISTQPDEETLQTSLRGTDPVGVFTAGFHAVQFYCDQIELASSAAIERQKEEYDKKCENYRRKLTEVHSAYKKEKSKKDELNKAFNSAKARNKELYQKYEQKAGEKRKIEQMFNELKSGGGGANDNNKNRRGGFANNNGAFSNEERREDRGGILLNNFLDEDPFGADTHLLRDSRRQSVDNPIRRSLQTTSRTPPLNSLSNDSHGEVTTTKDHDIINHHHHPPSNKAQQFEQNIGVGTAFGNRRRSSFGIAAKGNTKGFTNFQGKPQYNKGAANPFVSRRI